MTKRFIPQYPSDTRVIREHWYRVAILPKFELIHWQWFESNLEGRWAVLDSGKSFYLENENDVVLFRLTWYEILSI